MTVSTLASWVGVIQGVLREDLEELRSQELEVLARCLSDEPGERGTGVQGVEFRRRLEGLAPEEPEGGEEEAVLQGVALPLPSEGSLDETKAALPPHFVPPHCPLSLWPRRAWQTSKQPKSRC